ncbi:MAG: polysaccharide deacetylase family protein [Akkermansiaceae bacterium]
MKISLYKILATVSASVIISSCGSMPIPGSSPEEVPAPVAPVQVPQNRQYVAPTVKAPVPLNPANNYSRDISGSSQITWNRGSANSRYIALTFDDGPVTSNTTRLLEMLKRRNVKATFYVIGTRVQSNPSLVRRMVAEGHEIGNHTWTHPKLTSLSDSQVRSELNKTRDAITSATGIKPRTMRPPYGALSTRQRSMIFSEYGYPTILWDVDPEDWRKPGVSVVRNRVISGTKNGSIILLHDLHSSSVDAVPGILDELLRRGYKFVTVSQLIALKNSGQ